MDPPARNCMWRFGYSTPVNYDDNQLWCGGRASETKSVSLINILIQCCMLNDSNFHVQ